MRIYAILLLLFCAIQSLEASAQNTKWVRLEKKMLPEDIGGLEVPLTHSDKFADFKGISTYKQDSIWMGRIILNPKQYYFDRLKESKTAEDKSRYLAYIEKTRIDTTQLSRKPLKTFIGVLSVAEGNFKTIIVDADNDHDFSNEIKISYPLNTNNFYYDNLRKSLTHDVTYEYFVNGTIRKQTESIQIIPYDKAYTEVVKSDTVKNTFFKISSYLVGKLNVGDMDLEVNVLRKNPISVKEGVSEYTFNIVPVTERRVFYNWITDGENFKLADKIFTVLEMSRDSILVQYRNTSANDFGWQTGDYMPDFLREKYEINFSKKFVFLNFWGSWCGPCIKELPQLSDLSVDNEYVLNIINVANESVAKDFPKATKIIDSYSRKWKNFYEIINSSESLSTKLNVSSFPTIIVLDTQGKIVAREIGFGNIDKLKKMFNLN